MSNIQYLISNAPLIFSEALHRWIFIIHMLRGLFHQELSVGHAVWFDDFVQSVFMGVGDE